jgi:hypothetical protein
MQFRSERDQQLASKVISQMIDLVISLLQRMEVVQNEANLSAVTVSGSDPGYRLYAVSGPSIFQH